MLAEPIGRGALVEDVTAWLDTAQLVLLVGPPGIGKSAVAGALEADVWVSAEEAGAVDEVVGRAARALGCAVERPEAVVDALAGVELVVLDGYDLGPHDLDEVLAAWTAVTRVVVTSRQHLPAWSPHLEVGPLSPVDGAAVLRAHVRDPRRAAALDEAGLEALSEALDGVPFALAVIAARLRLYTPEQLIRQVADLEAGTLQGGPGPVRSLAGALSIRLGALSDDARRVLGAAAWLPGRFEIGALAAAAGGPVDELVLELLDASLLHGTTDAPPRLQVLAPVRAAVLSEARAADRGAVLERLAAHVLPLAEGAAQRGTPADLEQLGDLRGLLEALLRSPDGAVRLRAALALAARERRTGPSKAILDRAHSLPDEGPAELRVRWGLMVVRTACGALKPDLAEEVLPRIEPLVDDGTRAEFLIAQSFLRLVRRDPTASASLARQAIVLDPAPRHHLRLGVALFELGEQAEAVEAFQRARQDTDPFRRGHATYGLCTAMMEQHVAAADTLQLVQQAETEGVHAYPWLSCRFHFLRGALQSELGELDEAQREYLQAAEMHRVLGEAPSQLFMELNAYSLGFAARRVPEELLTLTPDEPTPYGRAMLGVWRAVTHAVLGHHHAAEAVGLPALEQLGQISPREAHRMACLLAVALAPARPALATSLLPVEDDALLELARAAVDGQLVQPSDWIEERILAGIASLTRPRVVVARDGSAFIGEDGERVDIARRRVLRRILEALAAAEAPLDVDAICACVWPGERLVGQSGTRRVHVAISTLRGLGLRSAIETDVTGDVTTWRLEAELVDAL